MDSINEIHKRINRPVKFLQYGEGIFCRGFVDYMIDIANEHGVMNANVALIKPVPFGSLKALKAQDGFYSVYLRGTQKGELFEECRAVTCVSEYYDAYSDYNEYAELCKNPDLRFVVSNTSDAGIAYDENDKLENTPPNSFPGKLTKFLYERYLAFDGAASAGLIILPCEMIENNAERLLHYCIKLVQLWELPEGFVTWLNNNCMFCNTLTDRIVTGCSADELKSFEKDFLYADKLVVKSEPFALWVIECDDPDSLSAELPLDKARLPVIFTNKLKPYRERKIRLMNGAHTATAVTAYLSGLNIVEDIVKDHTLRPFLERVLYSELVPMVPLPTREVCEFADMVMERFANPYIKHNLLTVTLNYVRKFKEHILPTILETYDKKGYYPIALSFSLAALMKFYSGSPDGETRLSAMRGNDKYAIMDSPVVLKFFVKYKDLPVNRFVPAFLKHSDIWGRDLSALPGFTDIVTKHFKSIDEHGCRMAADKLLRGLV